MIAYATFHAFIMWGFYVLGCLLVAVLILMGLAWCWDRWCRRNARKEVEARRRVRHEVTFNPELFL